MASIIGVAGLLFTALQWVLAREKHRQDWFDRRYAAYVSFFRLSIFAFCGSVPGYEGPAGGQRLIEEAFISKAQARFLVDNAAYDGLEKIYAEAFWLINSRKIMPEMASAMDGKSRLEEWRKYEDRRLAFEASINRLHRLFQPYLEASNWLSRKS